MRDQAQAPVGSYAGEVLAPQGAPPINVRAPRTYQSRTSTVLGAHTPPWGGSGGTRKLVPQGVGQFPKCIDRGTVGTNGGKRVLSFAAVRGVSALHDLSSEQRPGRAQPGRCRCGGHCPFPQSFARGSIVPVVVRRAAAANVSVTSAPLNGQSPTSVARLARPAYA